MRKIFLFLLGFSMFTTVNAQVWDGTAAAWTEGTGTEEDPYVISTPQQLAYLNQQVDAGETYEGKYFKLANDLDLGRDKGFKFDPIGFFDEYYNPEDQSQLVDDSKYFLGVFDGNNKTIDNAYIYFVDKDNYVGGTGLFACISGKAEIKNLTVGANCQVEGLDGTGPIVGAMTGGTVYNCENKSSYVITENFGQGGIVGSQYGGTVSCCVNSGNITGSTNVGGISGYVDRGAKIENCYNRGAINFSGFYAGGIVGYLVDGSVSNCYNIGKVSTDWSGAAIVGTTDPGVVIDNCYYLTLADGATDENTGVTAKADAEMKTAEFLQALDKGQGVWVADDKGINSGYPILKWQDGSATSIASVVTGVGGDIVVDGHYVSTTAEAPCRIVVTALDGTTVADDTVNGGGVYVPGAGVYIATVYKAGAKQSVKVIIR